MLITCLNACMHECHSFTPFIMLACRLIDHLNWEQPLPACRRFIVHRPLSLHHGVATPSTISRVVPRRTVLGLEETPPNMTTPFNYAALRASPVCLFPPSSQAGSSPLTPPPSFTPLINHTSPFSCEIASSVIKLDSSTEPRPNTGLCRAQRVNLRKHRSRRTIRPDKPPVLGGDPFGTDIWPMLYPSVQCR